MQYSLQRICYVSILASVIQPVYNKIFKDEQKMSNGLLWTKSLNLVFVFEKIKFKSYMS